jgi:hypothetical protein
MAGLGETQDRGQKLNAGLFDPALSLTGSNADERYQSSGRYDQNCGAIVKALIAMMPTDAANKLI